MSLHYFCLKATIENKTSITTHFKKLTTAINVFIVSVIVQSNCRILQFIHQMFNVSALLLDDALLKCVVTEVVLFSVVSFKTLTFHHVGYSVSTHFRCGEIYSESVTKNFL